jgi:hypothetical protein
VFNPVAEQSVFNVKFQGEGLLGDPMFVLGPHQYGKYELIYSPLLPTRSTGAVFFESESVGEFWYKLNLRATEPDDIDVELIKCILGKNAEKPMQIENPSKHQIVLKQKSTNPQLFDIYPEKVIVPPFETAEFFIRFYPNSLETIETGTLELYSKKVGHWVYHVKGEGLPP